MIKNEIGCTIIMALICLGIIAFVSFLMETSLKVYMGLAILGIIFSLFFYLLNLKMSVHIDSLQAVSKLFAYSRLLFTLIYLFSLIICLVINPTKSLFLPWSEIPPSNYIRIIAALLLAYFLPGYAILDMVDFNGEIVTPVKILLSYALSIFINSFLTFLYFLLKIDLFDRGFILLLASESALLIFYTLFSIVNRKLRPESYISCSTKEKRYDVRILLLFLCLMLFASIAFCSVYFSEFSSLRCDMWGHFQKTLRVIKGMAPYMSTQIAYPFWFHYPLASFFLLSGGLWVNSYMATIFLNMFSFVGFYVMVRSFFKNEKVAAVGTVIWSTFSGFEWIYGLYLKVTTDSPWYNTLWTVADKTINGGIFTYTGFCIWGYQPHILSLTLLLALIYVIREERLSSHLRYFMITCLFSLIYLLHVAEAVYICAVILPAFILLYGKEDLKRSGRTIIFIVLGIILVSAVDLCSLGKYYSRQVPIFLATIAFSSVIFLIQNFSKRNVFLVNGKASALKRVKWIFIGLLWYIWFLSYIIWVDVYPTFSRAYVLDSGIIPWYFYPLKLGVVGILLVIGISYILCYGTTSKDLKFFVFILTASFIFFKMISFINVNWFHTGFWERYGLYVLFIPVSVLAAYGLTKILRWIKLSLSKHPHLKHALVFSLLSILVTSGVSSTLLAVDYWTLEGANENLSKNEVEAFNFIVERQPQPTDRVVAASYFSNLKLALTGLNTVTKRWMIFEQTRPETVFSILSLANVKYIYLTPYDITYAQDSFIVKHFIKYLPVLFNNTIVTIYEVPNLTPPGTSNFSLIMPSEASINDLDFEERYFYPLSMVALSGLRYSISFNNDPERFNYTILLLPYDPPYVIARKYLNWVSLGGKLIVLDGLGPGTFAEMLFSSSQKTNVAQTIIFENGETINLPVNIRVPQVNLHDSSISIDAYYICDENHKSPFSLTKKYHNGEIMYVRVHPIFSVLKENIHSRRLLFIKLGEIFSALRLPLAKYVEPPIGQTESALGAVGRKGAEFRGKVTVSSNSFAFSGATIQAKQLSIISNSISVNNSRYLSSELLLSNVSTIFLDIYGNKAVKFVLSTINARVMKDGFGLYSSIMPEEKFNITINLPVNSTLALVTFNETNILDLKVQGGTVNAISCELNTSLPLKNSDIEEDSNGDGFPDGWTSTSKDCLWVKDNSFSGEYSLKISTNDNTTSHHWISDFVEIPLGTLQVKLSAALKTENVTSGKELWHKACIGLYFYDANKKYIYPHRTFVLIDGTHDWKKYQSTFTLPPNTKYVRVQLSLFYCTGTVWFDDFKLERNPLLLFKNPKISVDDGEILFEEMYFGFPYNQLITVWGRPLILDGYITTGVSHHGDNMLILSSLSYNGTAKVFYPYYSEWGINWVSILTSKHVVFLTVLFFAILLLFCRKHRKMACRYGYG